MYMIALVAMAWYDRFDCWHAHIKFSGWPSECWATACRSLFTSLVCGGGLIRLIQFSLLLQEMLATQNWRLEGGLKDHTLGHLQICRFGVRSPGFPSQSLWLMARFALQLLLVNLGQGWWFHATLREGWRQSVGSQDGRTVLCSESDWKMDCQ